MASSSSTRCRRCAIAACRSPAVRPQDASSVAANASEMSTTCLTPDAQCAGAARPVSCGWPDALAIGPPHRRIPRRCMPATGRGWPLGQIPKERGGYTARPFVTVRAMFFKNLCLYRLPTPWDISAAELESRLDARPLSPCGHFDMTTRGWVPVGPTARRLHTVENHQMIALGVEQKLLPASVIRQVAADRAAEVAAEQGVPVGRKQMRDIRLRVTEELRARALVKRRVTHAWLDRANGWLVVDAGGVARAEEVVETLRDTLGSFAATQVNTATSPRAAMARWAASGEVGHHIGVDDELELQ